MKTTKGIFCLMAVSAMLSACGGGGGGDGGGVAQAATVPKPVLIEAYGDGTTVGCTLTAASSAINPSCPVADGNLTVATTTEPQALQTALQASLGSTVTVSNKGVYGLMAADLLNGTTSGKTWDAMMQASPAQIVTINLGISDAIYFTLDSTFQSALINLVQIARAHGKKVVLFTPNPIIGPNPQYTVPTAQVLNSLRQDILSVASQLKVPVADDYAALSIANWVPLIPGGDYPSADGYKTKANVEAQTLAPIVKSLQ